MRKDYFHFFRIPVWDSVTPAEELQETMTALVRTGKVSEQVTDNASTLCLVLFSTPSYAPQRCKRVDRSSKNTHPLYICVETPCCAWRVLGRCMGIEVLKFPLAASHDGLRQSTGISGPIHLSSSVCANETPNLLQCAFSITCGLLRCERGMR